MKNDSDCLSSTTSHGHCLLKWIIVLFLLSPEALQAEAPAAPEAPPAELSRDELLAGWESIYGRMIKNMDVEFTYTLIDKQIPDDPNHKSTNYSIFGTVGEPLHTRLLQDGDRVRCLRSKSPEGFNDPYSIRGYSFDGSTRIEYSGRSGHGVIIPDPMKKGAYNALADVLVCNSFSKCESHPSWAGKPFLLLTLRDYDNGGDIFPNVKVHPVQEQVAGEWCHVLELVSTDSPLGNVKVWMATEKSMLVMRYERTAPVQSDTIEVHETAKIKTEMGDVWYPTRASSCRRYGRKENGSLVLKHQLTVHKFVPFVKPGDDEFILIFPIGTRVYDKGLEIEYTVSETGE